MPYIICNDNGYYLSKDSQGYYQVTMDVSKAATWPKSVKAQNVVKSLSKKFNAYNFKATYVLQENSVVSKPAEQTVLGYDILDKVKEIAVLAKQAEERKAYIQTEIHNVELEIVDIEHAAEFYNLNAAQGYKLYKMLHDARVKRRELKDELEKINMFLGTSIKSDSMENLKKSIMGLDGRQYAPRINNELFGV